MSYDELIDDVIHFFLREADESLHGPHNRDREGKMNAYGIYIDSRNKPQWGPSVVVPESKGLVDWGGTWPRLEGDKEHDFDLAKTLVQLDTNDRTFKEIGQQLHEKYRNNKEKPSG